MFLVNPVLLPKADIHTLIYMFTHKFTLGRRRITQNHIHRLHMVKMQKTKISFYSPTFLSVCLSFFFSHSKALGRKRRERKRRRPLFAARLLKRLYRAWQRGPACPSLVVLFILCAIQGVSNALGLCVGKETTHHILSSVSSWGMGAWGAVEQKGDKKQTYRRPRLFKAEMHKGL